MEQALRNCYTAWANVRLACSDCQAEDILKGILEGPRLKVLQHSLTGAAPKRLDSLDGLTLTQKATRLDWFVEALKKSKKLPHALKVDTKMISLQSGDHTFPLLWHLMCSDITHMWEIAPLFLRRKHLNNMLAEPIKFGPCNITKAECDAKPFYTTASGKLLGEQLRRRCPQNISPQKCVFEIVNRLLKTTADGRRLHVNMESDLVNSKVLCALTNALIPETMPTEVILNDRWSMNLALRSFSKIMCVHSSVDSEDLYEGNRESSTAFLAYVLMTGLQFSQASAVVKKMEMLMREQKVIQSELGDQKSTHHLHLSTKLDTIREEMSWLLETYDYEKCKEWLEHAETTKLQVKMEVTAMMQKRFDIVTVPRPMTINQLIERLVISLSLTGGNGFYLADGKENLWTGRKVVIRDKKTGEFFEDFSGYDNHKGSVREMLGLFPCEVVEVNPSQHPQYELFFESTSRNKSLKANASFLYQVFPGTTSQCRRQLIRAARLGEVETVRKLISFFKSNKAFVNSKDPETGNTALHMASRHGHMDVAVVLLENGAQVNTQNTSGCTSFFLSTEGLHKRLSQLLLEWGADIHLKNRISKTAVELIRNVDLKDFLIRKNAEYKELAPVVLKGDHQTLESYIEEHISQKNPMASLTSRCVKGNTLLHVAASTGCLKAVKMLLGQQVRAHIRNDWDATPIHVARDPLIMQELVEHNANVNSPDVDGNTPLHHLCMDERHKATTPDCISILIGHGASIEIENNAGFLPVHCAASHGLTVVVECLLACDEEHLLQDALQQSVQSSLPYLALMGNHLQCAKWLTEQKFLFHPEELDQTLLKMLQRQPNECSKLVECVEFILQQGANPNALYSKGSRPLHLAVCFTSQPDIVEVLLENGAEMNVQNNTGMTPLIAACQANSIHSASKLVENGADTDVRDVTGKCGFEYITDYEEWIQSGLFSSELISKLKCFKLKQGKQLVSSIARVVKTQT